MGETYFYQHTLDNSLCNVLLFGRCLLVRRASQSILVAVDQLQLSGQLGLSVLCIYLLELSKQLLWSEVYKLDLSRQVVGLLRAQLNSRAAY